MKLLFLATSLYLAACSHSIPTLPESKLMTYTWVSGQDWDMENFCISQSFTITNEFIGFEKDSAIVDKELCLNITGFPLEDWNKFDKFLKSLYDTHNLPNERINLKRTSIKKGVLYEKNK